VSEHQRVTTKESLYLGIRLRVAHQPPRYNWKKTPDIIDDRDFLGRAVWKKKGDASFEVVTAPETSERRGPRPNTVRAEYPTVMKIIRVGEQETRIEYVIQPSFGGQAEAKFAWVSRRYIASNLARVAHIQEHFLGERGLDEWDEKDGEATAEVLVAKTKAETHHGKGETRVEARVTELIRKQKGLKELGQKHEWFEVLLTKIVENKLRPAGDSKAKLCNISAKQARVIGCALASCIAANLTAPAAVDEWILRYPAMGELEREYVRERSECKKELELPNDRR
jgi:hypothetical protein